jgi:hypothetical protein
MESAKRACGVLDKDNVRPSVQRRGVRLEWSCGSPRVKVTDVLANTRDSLDDEAESTGCRPEMSRVSPSIPTHLLANRG